MGLIQEGPRSIESKEARESQPQKTSKDGFESFINPGKKEKGLLFINAYNGNFAQNMELNRKTIERALKIAHLDGQVVLTSLTPYRRTSADVNPDGTVTAKRALSVGEKIEQEEKDNPYYMLVNIPQGWRIEVNDKRIIEELTEKEGLGAREVQRAFVRKFDESARKGLIDCIIKEKLTKEKLSLTLLTPAILVSVGMLAHQSVWVDIEMVLFTNFAYNLSSFLLNFTGEEIPRRKLDHFWEIVMPPAEVDKVLGTLIYLSVKGKRLVKEKAK